MPFRSASPPLYPPHHTPPTRKETTRALVAALKLTTARCWPLRNTRTVRLGLPSGCSTSPTLYLSCSGVPSGALRCGCTAHQRAWSALARRLLGGSFSGGGSSAAPPLVRLWRKAVRAAGGARTRQIWYQWAAGAGPACL